MWRRWYCFPTKNDSEINVKVEFGEGKVPLDNIAKRAEAYKPKERVTYKMVEKYIEAKYGFKVHIAVVKRDLGLPRYDAPNAVKELLFLKTFYRSSMINVFIL